MNTERIKTALRALLNRDNDDAFVIFEDKASGKFVQFVGSADQPLLLDLPVQTLSADEEQRARVLFRELGLRDGTSTNLHDQPGAQDVGGEMTYQLELEQDSERAAEITIRIFYEVYRFPAEFDLGITEN